MLRPVGRLSTGWEPHPESNCIGDRCLEFQIPLSLMCFLRLGRLRLGIQKGIQYGHLSAELRTALVLSSVVFIYPWTDVKRTELLI